MSHLPYKVRLTRWPTLNLASQSNIAYPGCHCLLERAIFKFAFIRIEPVNNSCLLRGIDSSRVFTSHSYIIILSTGSKLLSNVRIHTPWSQVANLVGKKVSNLADRLMQLFSVAIIGERF